MSDFAPNGPAREFLKSKFPGEDWVASFCDRIHASEARTHVEDFTLKYGAAAANVARTRYGTVQLNLRWRRDDGWAVYTAETYADAVAQAWSDYHRRFGNHENSSTAGK